MQFLINGVYEHIFNVRKPGCRSHKIDGERGDGNSYTCCGIELTQEFGPAEDGITCRTCSDALDADFTALNH